MKEPIQRNLINVVLQETVIIVVHQNSAVSLRSIISNFSYRLFLAVHHQTFNNVESSINLEQS